jgi:hypothetical protein
MGFKADFFGEGDRYDYASMCMPVNPFRASSAKPTNFYSKGKFRRAMRSKLFYLVLPDESVCSGGCRVLLLLLLLQGVREW